MKKEVKVEIPRKDRPELEAITNLEDREKVQQYMDNYDWVTDISEKFNDPNICCICGDKKYSNREGKPYCNKHYSQLIRLGELKAYSKKTTPNEIKIVDDYAVLVTRDNFGKATAEFLIDIESIVKVIPYRWHVDGDYCGKSRSTGTRFLHSLIIGNDTSKLVDHINRNKKDNRLSNLRLATRSENGSNRSLGKNNGTGFIGVHYYERIKKYTVILRHNGYAIPNLSYEELDEAVTARLTAEYHILGEEFAPQRHLFNDYPIDRDIKDIKAYYRDLKAKRTSEGFAGVRYDEKSNSYEAHLWYKNKMVGDKYFKLRDDAIKFRLQLEKNCYPIGKAPQEHLFEEYGIVDVDHDLISRINRERLAKNKFGVSGVSFCKRDRLYVATYKYKGEEVLRMTTKVLLEAQKARLQAEYDNEGMEAKQAHLFKEFGIID